MDALERLVDVELPGPARVVDPAPVVNAIGGIRRGLYLGDEQPASDGMGGSRRKEVALTSLDRDLCEQIGGRAVLDGPGELLRCDLLFQPLVDHCAGLRVDYIPAFGLGLAPAHPPAGLGVGMHLHAQDVLGIEQLDQQGERAGEIECPGDLLRVFLRDIGDGAALEWSIGDDGLVVRQVRQFPALSDLRIGRQRLAKGGLECSATPYPLLEDRHAFHRVRFHTRHSTDAARVCPRREPSVTSPNRAKKSCRIRTFHN